MSKKMNGKKAVLSQRDAQLRMIRANNEVSYLTGRKYFMTTIFMGDDGVYYDPVADEFFIAEQIGINPAGPIYGLEFDDGMVEGLVKDHGFLEYLGKL